MYVYITIEDYEEAKYGVKILKSQLFSLFTWCIEQRAEDLRIFADRQIEGAYTWLP